MPPRLDLPAASCESCVGDSAPEVSGPLEWEWWLRIGRASKEAGTEGETGIPRAFLAVETLYFISRCQHLGTPSSFLLELPEPA